MKYLVLKIGGSLISPEGKFIDENLVASYVNILKQFFSVPRDIRVLLIIGGGNTAREYKNVIEKLSPEDVESQHSIGASVTCLNAELLRLQLKDLAYPATLGSRIAPVVNDASKADIGEDIEKWLSGKQPIMLCGGFVLFVSTDYDALFLASKVGADQVYKISNVEYVYTADPKTNADSKVIEDISWDQYIDAFTKDGEHRPGNHLPVDAMAAVLGRDNAITVNFASGKDPEVLKAILEGNSVKGTVIHP